jgi:hypothetical protein
MNSNKHNFFISVWTKYLSVIRILLKKSATQEQLLVINRSDFERAGAANKSGYRFTVNFINGKPDALFSGNDLVQTFISVLTSDEVINDHLSKSDYTFTFTSKYQLYIKNNNSSKPTEESPELTKEETFTGEQTQ